MLKFISIAFLLFLSFVSQCQSYQVTFRKNITLPPGEFFFLNHTYTKESQGTTIDYISSVTTSYNITLVKSSHCICVIFRQTLMIIQHLMYLY